MNWKRIVLTAALGAAVGLTGCSKSTKAPPRTGPVGDSADMAERRTGADWPLDRERAPAPAPKAAPAPVEKPAPVAKPAPAPAPVGMTTGKLYIPTGEAMGSVLLVEKTQPGEVQAGKPFDYEVKVTNISKNKLEGVAVTDQLSNNLQLSNNAGASVANGVATIPVGTLNPGESKSYKMTATATGGDSIRNCVSATYNTTLCLTSPVVAPALKVTKTLPAEVLVCDAIPVKVVVTNTGTGAARGVKLDDALPAGMTVDGKNSVSMDVGTLAAGQSREVAFTAKVAKTGKYDNKVTATAEGGMTAESAVASVVAKQPVLVIDVKCPPAKVRAGTNVTHEITVTNKGDGVAADTTVRGTGQTTIASATEGGTASGQEVVWKLGNLNPGQSKTMSVTAKAPAGVINTSFAVTAKCADAANAKCTFEAAGVPDIGVLMTDADGVIMVGTNHTFEYSVTNQGQIDLTNVMVEFTPDQGLEYVTTTAPGAAPAAGAKQAIKIGTVKVGETRKFNVVYKGTSEGVKFLKSMTTSDQTTAMAKDEQVNYVK